MSHNDNRPERSARRHKPALIAIAVALLVAAIAFLFFIPGAPDQDGIATTPPPAGTTSTEAEGTDADDAAPVVVPDPVEGTVPEGQTTPAE